MESLHESVLLDEVVDALVVRPTDTLVDATLGGAGHFKALLVRLGEGGTLIGIDADRAAVERARLVYAADRRAERPVAHLLNDNFRNLARILERLGIGRVDKVLFDLGWSGYQINEARGFSFMRDEPLLMTYGESGETAADVVNGLSETELADIIYAYGDEHFSRGIAKAIVAARKKAPLTTTKELVQAIEAGVPRFYTLRKTHFATKTFQALRIAVNDEFGALREGLAAALAALAPAGRIAVISFHSAEDRIVKTLMGAASARGEGALVFKKPVTPSRSELVRNRRARSAKLRVFERAPLLVVAPLERRYA